MNTQAEGTQAEGTQAEGTQAPGKRACGCEDGCCGGERRAPVPASAPRRGPAADDVRDQVRAGYAQIAAGGCCAPSAGGGAGGSGQGGGCCGLGSGATYDAAALAQAIGYASGDLAALPEGVNLGLSCGNPAALAALRPGEVVLDLGSGAGFDAFIAGPRVGAGGAGGRVIGVDMTAEMVRKARGHAAEYRAQTGLDNVEFRLGEIEALPVADASVDVVISNCVLNLSPEKERVWAEIARVLRPGGRVAISDLALLRPLPASVRGDVEALIGCIAGAALVEDLERQARGAGLEDVRVRPKAGYVQALTGWDDPLYRSVCERLPAGTTAADYVTSVTIEARKSGAAGVS